VSLNNLVNVYCNSDNCYFHLQVRKSFSVKIYTKFSLQYLAEINSESHAQADLPKCKRFSHGLDRIECGADKWSQEYLWKEESTNMYRKEP